MRTEFAHCPYGRYADEQDPLPQQRRLLQPVHQRPKHVHVLQNRQRWVVLGQALVVLQHSRHG
jgi:hypothetical protein